MLRSHKKNTFLLEKRNRRGRWECMENLKFLRNKNIGEEDKGTVHLKKGEEGKREEKHG